MAKRFTATEKWEDAWFSELNHYQKLCWLYLLDKCDTSGIWEKNFKAASFFLGFTVSEMSFDFMKDKREEVNGNKWFIPKFIEFQYGELSENCKPHIPIIKQLERYNLKGYSKGIHTLNTIQEKEKDNTSISFKEEGRQSVLMNSKENDILQYFAAKGYPAEEAKEFFNHYEAQGWVTGNNVPISNWKVKAENWHTTNAKRNLEGKTNGKFGNSNSKGGATDADIIAIVERRANREKIKQPA